MSLDFNFENIENWEEVVTDPINPKLLHPVTNHIIWSCLYTDIGTLSAKSVDEFIWRIRMLQCIDGPDFKFGTGEEFYLTDADVMAHLGLKTNVITITRDKWLKQKVATRSFKPREQEEARSLYTRIAKRNTDDFNAHRNEQRELVATETHEDDAERLAEAEKQADLQDE